MNYQNPFSRWPRHDGYREVERIADVALMPADEVPKTTVEWLWPNTIPIGHLTIVAGEPGGGKSFWMADLAARVSFMRPWPYADRQGDGANAGGTPTPQIQNPKSEVVPADVTATFLRKTDRRLEREQAGKWALERLAEGPVEARMLFDDAAAFGFRERTLRRALGELGLKPTKCGNDGPWMWWLERVQGSGFRVQPGAERGREGETERGSDAEREQVGDCKTAVGEGSGGEQPAAKPQDQSPKTSGDFEDCQLAHEGEVAEGVQGAQGRPGSGFRKKTEQTKTQDPKPKTSDPIQNPTSKIQNPADVGLTADDKITIVVLHPSASGAEVSAADATPQAQPP